MNNEVNLTTWIKGERARLEEFAAMWRRMSDCDDSQYPPRMEPGDWDQQYAAFEYNQQPVR